MDHDKAGRPYWDHTWDSVELAETWDIGSRGVRGFVRRAFFSYVSTALRQRDIVGADRRLIEVGCANSGVLPVFASKLGLSVSGLDYSPTGCERARRILEREGVAADIYCCDVFSPPDAILGNFDAVVSFGLVEHFAHTASIIGALAKLLKPGGLLFTTIPNLGGINGALQRYLDRDIYAIHLPLTAAALGRAHADARLEVVACHYFLATNFGILNVNSIPRRSAEWFVKKTFVAFLHAVSASVWGVEMLLGALPTGPAFSPYINCVAIKSSSPSEAA